MCVIYVYIVYIYWLLLRYTIDIIYNMYIDKTVKQVKAIGKKRAKVRMPSDMWYLQFSVTECFTFLFPAFATVFKYVFTIFFLRNLI